MSRFRNQSQETTGPTVVKTVRISILPSPPPETHMDDQQQPRRSWQRTDISHSQGDNHVVFPTDSIEEKPQLRSGSKWRQHDLELLKVKFDPDDDSQLSMLNVEHEWTQSQLQSMLSDSFPARF